MIQAKDNPRYDYLMGIVNLMPDCPGVYRYFPDFDNASPKFACTYAFLTKKALYTLMRF